MNLFDQVTRTKIILPRRRPDLLTRQRLLDLLFDFLDCKLIIIAAPAGYGKTSLLLDMAYQAELPACWYALDSLDKDFQRFATHFVAAIAHRFPRFGQRSWATLQNGLASSSDLDQLVSIMVNEIYERVQEHFMIVLDDYHFVEDSQEIDYFVNQFVQKVDQNCHLAIASRTLLTLPDLPLMVARSQVGGLSFDELEFRADEIQSLMLQNHHVSLPDSVAEELVRETEGWITGLLLSTQTVWQTMTDRLQVARASGVGLYDYLAQQVLDQQSISVRDFLLHSSLMEEFDSQLCEEVLGPDPYPGTQSWQSLIEEVLQNNLFALPVENKGTWLRYHHLFQEFLQDRMAQEQPQERIRILRRLASAYIERGEWEKAHAQYQCLGDTVSTINLIEQAGSSLVREGRLLTLAEWLDQLPNGALATRPLLLSLRGVAASMLGDVERGLYLQAQAKTAFERTGNSAGLAQTLLRQATDHRFLGNYELCLANAQEALAIAQGNGDEKLRDIQAEALRAKGLALFSMGQLHMAIDYLNQSLAIYNLLNDAQRVALLRMELGLTYYNAGCYNQALIHYNQALDYWHKTGNVSQQANLLNNIGVLNHLRGDYEQAGSLLEDALVCANQSGYVRVKVAVLIGIGDLYADLDALDAAQAAYQQAEDAAQHIDDLFLILYLGLAQAALARLKGEVAQAYDFLSSTTRLVQQSTSGFEQGLYDLEAGRLAQVRGDWLQAIAHLEKATHRFDDGGQSAESAQSHLYLALAYHKKQDTKAVRDHLQEVFQLSTKLDSQHPLLVAGRDAKEVLGAFERDPSLGRQASQLLRQVVEFEQSIPILRRRLRRSALKSIPLSTPLLRIQALGKAQVTMNGKAVTSTNWQTYSARDLFFCLVAHPEGLTKEEVGAIFWPESTPAELKLKFKNAIYRLRQALVQDCVLFDGDRYRFNREQDYEYDVESFVSKLEQAQTAIDPTEQLAAYQAALLLYQGPYLPEAEGEWAWWERERLARAYLEGTLKLAELYLQSHQYEHALDYCQRALTEDICLEEAHRLAMCAHAALGNRADIVRQFELCQQALLDEVNVDPSPQTVTLYQTLIR